MGLDYTIPLYVRKTMYNTVQNFDDDILEFSPSENKSSVNIHEKDEPDSADLTILSDLQTSRRWLYLSHFFAHFSENYWQFFVVLFLTEVPLEHSIFYVSTFGLSLNVGSFFITPWLGKWIDGRRSEDQLHIIRYMLAGKHSLPVILSFVCYCGLSLIKVDLVSSQNGSFSIPMGMTLFIIHVVGTVAHVLEQSFNVVIERDLVVDLSHTTDETDISKNQQLSRTNATMKSIALIAPGMISFLILGKLELTCLLVAIVAIVSWTVEYYCFTKIFLCIPVMKQREETLCVDTVDNEEERQKNRWSISIYCEQPGAIAGLSLALLYANSVTFGNGMLTAYLLNEGMSAGTIAVFRGISSLIGLVGTVAYTYSLRLFTLEATGLWGVGSQAMSLAITLIFISLNNDNNTSSRSTFLYFSTISVCTSRLGLWVFDITATQIQQEETPEEIRCLVGGVQESLNAFFTILSFGLGLLCPSINDFIYISASGVIFVALSLLIFLCGIYVPRKVVKRPRDENSELEDNIWNVKQESSPSIFLF